MDKDSVILKYLQNETENCDKNITELSTLNANNATKLDVVDSKVDEIYKLLNKKRTPSLYEVKKVTDSNLERLIEQLKTYDELFNIAVDLLAKRGFDVDNLDYHNLVTEE